MIYMLIQEDRHSIVMELRRTSHLKVGVTVGIIKTNTVGMTNMKKLSCVAPISVALLAASMGTQAAINLEDKVEVFGDFRLRGEDYSYNYKSDSDRARIRLRIGAKVQVNDDISVKFRLRNNASNNDSSHDTLGADNSADFGYDQAYVSYTGFDNLKINGGKIPANYFRTTELYLEDTQIPEGVSATYKMGAMTVNSAHFIIDEERNGNTDLAWNHLQVVYGFDNLTLGLGHIALDDDTSDRLGDFEASAMTTLTAKAKMGKTSFTLDAILTNEDADTDYESQGQAYIAGLGYQLNNKLAGHVSYWRVGALGTLANGEFTQTDMHDLENFQGAMAQLKYKLDPKVTITPRLFYSETLDDSVAASVQDDGSAKTMMRYQMNLDVKF
jgi:hypothetical protein